LRLMAVPPDQIVRDMDGIAKPLKPQVQARVKSPTVER